jgi:hypothetical protein
MARQRRAVRTNFLMDQPVRSSVNLVTAKTAKTIVQRLGGHAGRAQPPARHLVQQMDRYDGVTGPVRDRMASIDGNQPGGPPRRLRRSSPCPAPRTRRCG